MCMFCEKYRLMQKMDLYSEVTFTLSASAILEHDALNEGLYGRNFYSMKTEMGFTLNFCPECGKELAK